MRIEIDMKIKAEEPGDPEAEDIAMEILRVEAQEFAITVRDRLEAQGMNVEAFSVGKP